MRRSKERKATMPITANTKVQVKLGKNIIDGEVLAELTESIYQVKNLRTGKIMTVPLGRIQPTLQADDARTSDGCTQHPRRALPEPPTCCVRETHEVQGETPTGCDEHLPAPSAKLGRKFRNGKASWTSLSK